MRFADPPTLDSPRRGNSGDELGGLLRAFLQSEMPHPWPTMQFPEEEAHASIPLPARRVPKARPLWRSRFALAASAALFLIVPALLSDSFSVKEVKPDAGTISKKKPDPTNATADIEGLPRAKNAASGVITNMGIIVTPGGAKVKITVEEDDWKKRLKTELPE